MRPFTLAEIARRSQISAIETIHFARTCETFVCLSLAPTRYIITELFETRNY